MDSEIKIKNKNNKVLGVITTNNRGLKEVRNARNSILAVYDPKRNETRDKNNRLLTNYDSLISVLHEHLDEEIRSRYAIKKNTQLAADEIISELKKVSISDINKISKSFSIREIFKEETTVRKKFLFISGMIVLVPIVLMVLILIAVKLTSFGR